MCLHVQMQDTPLHWAASNGHEAVTRALVEAGADVNAKDHVVQSKCAVVGCVLMEVVLRQRGGVCLYVQGKTLLDVATNRGHAGVMKLLQKTPATMVKSIGLAAGAAVTSTVGYGLYWLLTQGD